MFHSKMIFYQEKLLKVKKLKKTAILDVFIYKGKRECLAQNWAQILLI